MDEENFRKVMPCGCYSPKQNLEHGPHLRMFHQDREKIPFFPFEVSKNREGMDRR